MKHIIKETKKTEKMAISIKNGKSFFWNMIGGGISSTQSVIILFFAARYLETEYVGIFTIGYAIAVLGCTLAKYGIRTYQVTDVREEYSRYEYIFARIITVIGTMLIIIIYALFMHIFGRYGLEKSLTIVLICGWKLIEAFEDVLVGIYQQLHQLDMGAFIFSMRMGVSTVLYCVLIAITKSLLTATLIIDITSVLLSIICFAFGNKRNYVKIGKGNIRNALNVLVICFPLFVANSINIFVGNEPKYLVDILLNDIDQAYLGYIITPAYIIGLLSGFVYQPQIRNYGELWDVGEIEELKTKIIKQLLFTALVVLGLCIVGGVIGIPLLSWYYATDLYGLEKEFLMFIVGGGTFALSSFMLIILSVLRDQKFMACAYIVVSILSLFVGKVVVMKWNILGAAVLFLLINIMLFAIFAVKVIVLFDYRKKEV